ncbi:MAG: glucuronate isomerase [Anaerolineales bacterium]|nr:glucuronate isomerase [Anaerolineales bacterium]
MEIKLHPDRFFSPDPGQLSVARELYRQVEHLPLVCPHGHVDPRIFADPDYRFGSPTELLLIPDHYIFRMLYSAGVRLEDLGVPYANGSSDYDPRKAWQIFADHFHLFSGTPTGIWLQDEMVNVFGVRSKLGSKNAQEIYDQIDAQLRLPAFAPRALFEQFNIEVLCTTETVSDSLEYHSAIRSSGWGARILPTYRTDAVVSLDTPGWINDLHALEEQSGISISDFSSFISTLEGRREFFKSMGAVAADHAALTAKTLSLPASDMDAIFQRGLIGEVSRTDAAVFTAGMLVEMARMSAEDGLVMQLHVGSYRNHNPALSSRFGSDKGADIPVQTELTQNLKPLLDQFGNHPNFHLILFTLDESTYSREFAPLAGHYPALKLGPPWWFHDSIHGIERYLNQVVETAGIYNTVGFNDDTRAFPSIPARHDVWRRVTCNWIAGLLVRRIIDQEDAERMAKAMAYDLAKQAYFLD